MNSAIIILTIGKKKLLIYSNFYEKETCTKEKNHKAFHPELFYCMLILITFYYMIIFMECENKLVHKKVE
jgi:hypothetical protein